MSDVFEFSRADQILASTASYLISGNEHEAATVLLMCSILNIRERNIDAWNGEAYVDLGGPRAAYEILNEDNDEIHPIATQISLAFGATVRKFRGHTIVAQLTETLGPDWRTELQEIAAGRGVHNQAPDIPNREIVQWKNLRFRSQSEVRIASALDAAGVLFLPNCRARLGIPDQRRNLEADFLVCHEGKWGILEVDGPFHPRAAEDHDRDRLFQQHGIRVTQRFDWKECYDSAPGVVQRFLTLLARNG